MEFQATLELHGKTATGISIPPALVGALGAGKRPPVRVTLNGYSYRTTIAAYGEQFFIPVSAEHREAAGITAGQTLTVDLELDQEPRTVELPDDLAAALAAQPGATAAFNARSYTLRKEQVRQVETAKAPATRERRIAAILAKLAQG